MGMINLTRGVNADQTAAELIEIYKDRTSHIKDADIQRPFLPPTVPDSGNASGFELRFIKINSRQLTEFADVATLVENWNEDPAHCGATSGSNPTSTISAESGYC